MRLTKEDCNKVARYCEQTAAEQHKKDLMAYGKLAVLAGVLSEAEYYRLYDELIVRSTKTKKTKDETAEMMQMSTVCLTTF